MQFKTLDKTLNASSDFDHWCKVVEQVKHRFVLILVGRFAVCTSPVRGLFLTSGGAGYAGILT